MQIIVGKLSGLSSRQTDKPLVAWVGLAVCFLNNFIWSPIRVWLLHVRSSFYSTL